MSDDLGLDKGDQRERDDYKPAGPARNDLTEEQRVLAESWAGRVGLAMVNGHKSRAHELVDLGIIAIAAQTKAAILTMPLVELGLGMRVCNQLEKYCEAFTIEDVLQLDLNELMSIPNFSTLTVLHLFGAIAKFSVGRVIELEKLIVAESG